MNKQIYLLYSCDDWNTYENMQLLIVSTDFHKILNKIKTEIENGTMSYIKQLSDLETLNSFEIDRNLQGGMIQEYEDGEIIA